MSCQASSLIEIHYLWYGDNNFKNLEIREPCLTIFNLTKSFSHTYQCIASNKVGNVSKWFYLIPKGKNF